MSKLAALVRNDSIARDGAVFRFSEGHYRLLETLALPGEEEALVRPNMRFITTAGLIGFLLLVVEVVC